MLKPRRGGVGLNVNVPSTVDASWEVGFSVVGEGCLIERYTGTKYLEAVDIVAGCADERSGGKAGIIVRREWREGEPL